MAHMWRVYLAGLRLRADDGVVSDDVSAPERRRTDSSEGARTSPARGSAEAGADVHVPGMSVAAVARRLGVAPATLRTWDRRYGLGPSEHSAGSHRRYSPQDVVRLDAMKSLVTRGVPPGEAARAALSAEANPEAARQVINSLQGGEREPDERTPPTGMDFDAVESTPEDGASARGGGGRVVALPTASPEARGLARAALALDSGACFRIVADSLAKDGVVATWNSLLAPVLIGVGERWQTRQEGVEVEHVLSEAIVGALSASSAALSNPVNPRPILLAAAPSEMHTLPLFAVAAGLAEKGIGARMIGARTPQDALQSAIRRLGPAAVMLWCHSANCRGGDILRDLPAMRPAPMIVVGGRGWGTVPPGVEVVSDLEGALEVLVRSVG